MPFKKIEGHTSLFRATAVSQAQFDVAQLIIKANGGIAIIRNKDLHALTMTVTGKKYCPYYIGKNDALKVKSQPGMYDLGRLTVSKQVKAAPAPKDETAAPKAKAKKEKTPKATDAPKKGKKNKKEAPVATEAPAEAEVPEVTPTVTDSAE